MTTTPKMGAPELIESQADKEETCNTAFRIIEAGSGLFRVEDNDATAPPGSCADGAQYIPAATATGAWAGKEKYVAIAIGANASNGWEFVAPEEGMRAWVKDENAEFAYDGSAWVAYTATPSGTGTAATLDFDTDGTLAANSDAKIATQKAVKTAIAAAVTGLWDFKGSTDCSANPNYPAASKGDAYVVSVAGKIGGGSGSSVDVGDVYVASADNAGGTQASVGSSWFILEHNLTGAALSGAITSSGLTMATARLLGRTTASTGAVEEISAGQGLSLASGVLKVADASFRRTVEILVTDPNGSAITTGDGKAYFRVPETLDGLNLVAVGAAVTSVSTSGIPTVQIANVTDSVDMLSTKLTIDANETDSATAGAAAVIDGAHDDVATADMLRIDIDVAGTGAKGLIVSMTFG